MNKKITIKAVNALKPQSKIYDVRDTEIPGFVLRVRPTGTKTYLLFYRNKDGEKRTYTIGQGLTAVQARDIASKRRAEIAQGIDINAAEKEQKARQRRNKANTLQSFLDDVYSP